MRSNDNNADVHVLATPEVIEGEIVEAEEPTAWELAVRIHTLEATAVAMNGHIHDSASRLDDAYVQGWGSLWTAWRRCSRRCGRHRSAESRRDGRGRSTSGSPTLS